MKSVVVFLLAASSVAMSQDAVQWSSGAGANGHWYLLVEADLSNGNLDALQDIVRAELGADLVSIRSQGEQDFVTALSDGLPGWTALGAKIMTSVPCGPDSWEWFDNPGPNTPLEFTAWDDAKASPQPNCIGSEYIATWGVDAPAFGVNAGRWHDVNGEDITYTVIEWSADCNGDGLVDYGQILDGSLIDFDENGVPDICEARQWTTSEGGNGHWYQVIVLGQGTTTEKLAYARTVGAELASLVTPEEFDFAAFTVCDLPTYWIEDENGCLCGGPAIGGYRAPESDFSWLDGSVWDYSPWHGGNPDGASSDAQLVRLWDYFGNRRFVDHRLLGETGADIQSILLEWSSDCNGDGIVDYGQILDGSLMDQDGNGVPDGCAEVACCIGSTCIFSTALSCEQAGGTFENSDAGCSSQVCQSDCPGDITDDGQVDFTDLLIIVSTWGPCSDG